MSDDTEKRWHDPGAVRAAVLYSMAVIAAAVIACAVYALGDQHDVALAFAAPAVLFIGALGAFVKTYRDWRARRTWPIWQGAGWFLLTTALLALSIPSFGLTAYTR
jgi:hypothetical protein